jgi:hypothetical protein
MTFHDHSRLAWLPIGASAVLGAGFFVIGVREIIDGGPTLPGLAAVTISAVAILCISVFSQYAESISVTFDTGRRRVELTGWLPWRQRHESWNFDEVASIEPESWDDGDGAPVWRPAMVLKCGERVPLTANWHRNRELTDDLCFRARTAMHQ